MIPVNKYYKQKIESNEQEFKIISSKYFEPSKKAHQKGYPIVIIEGLPGTGKSTILSLFGKLKQAVVIEELQQHKKTSKHTVEYYIESDKIKYQKAKRAQLAGNKVFVDRSFYSTLAYNYAFDRTFNSNRFVRVQALIKQNELFNLSAIYVLLSTPLMTARKQKGRLRETEYIWTYSKFLKFYEKFYTNEFELLAQDKHLIVIDANNKDISQIFQEIISKI